MEFIRESYGVREESSPSAIKLVIYVGSNKLHAIFTPPKRVDNFCIYASPNARLVSIVF